MMASYKPAAKLTAGAYYSNALDRRAPFTSSRYQKDWTVSARYHFNPFLYLKPSNDNLNEIASIGERTTFTSARAVDACDRLSHLAADLNQLVGSFKVRAPEATRTTHVSA